MLGTTYGGDGKSNFALPDLEGRAPMFDGHGPGLSLHDLGETGGSETVTFSRARFPAHAHAMRAADAHYRQNYPGATLDVIEVDGEPAGRLYVYRGTSDIRIMDIALAPAFRGRGIGTGLLRSLIAESQESERKLSIHVEMNNRARTLCERLGFQAVGEHGVYVLMERSPT
jgi:ribosomal protein S18 acetylase RimI-like enzyme